MFVRMLIFAALGWLAWRWIVRKQAPADRAVAAPLPMVRCTHCNLHVPQRDALQQDGLWFCCAEHRKEHQVGGRES